MAEPTAQKMKFSIKEFFSKCDEIRRKLLLKKSLMENFIFCAASICAVTSKEKQQLSFSHNTFHQYKYQTLTVFSK